MNRTVWEAFFYLAFLCGFVTTAAQANVLLESVPIGLWGGKHIGLTVTEAGATVEYDCAAGKIDEPMLLDKDGNFEAHGIHVFERGGPYQVGEPPLKRHPVIYRGWTDGRQMRLTVTLLETGEDVGTFELALGRPPQLDKCL
jgi:hypothetical protein